MGVSSGITRGITDLTGFQKNFENRKGCPYDFFADPPSSLPAPWSIYFIGAVPIPPVIKLRTILKVRRVLSQASMTTAGGTLQVKQHSTDIIHHPLHLH